jgi:hypothetical protein
LQRAARCIPLTAVGRLPAPAGTGTPPAATSSRCAPTVAVPAPRPTSEYCAVSTREHCRTRASTRVRQDPLVVDLVRGGAFVRPVAPAAKGRLAEWVNPLYFSDAEVARIAGAFSRRCSDAATVGRLQRNGEQRCDTRRCAGLQCYNSGGGVTCHAALAVHTRPRPCTCMLRHTPAHARTSTHAHA